MAISSFYADLGFATNQASHLILNGVDLTAIITDDHPVYVMNESLIRQHLQAYQHAFRRYYPKSTSVFYASKAFLNLAMADLICQENVGIDVCSAGELFIAQKAEIPAPRILMHGNNKSRAELQAAVDAQIYAIVIDSVSEFDMLESLLTTQKASVMLRVNPTVHVDTHPSIATGVYKSKFGLPIDDPCTLDLIVRMSKSVNVVFKGLHFHIGSQVLDFQGYTDAIQCIIQYLAALQGQGIVIETLNIGGGLGVDDTEVTLHTIERFAKHVCTQLVQQCQRYGVSLPNLAIEPGRSIVSQAGCILYRIGHIKESDGITFLAVHGGMSDNMRVALYNVKYHMCVANKMDRLPVKPYKVVGNCCESGDILMEDIMLPACATGDILAVFNTGAYSHSLANQYNKHLIPGVVFVGDHTYRWVTKPQSVEDLICRDSLI